MRCLIFAILFSFGILSGWCATTVQTQVSTNQVTLNEPFVYAVIIVAEDAKDAPKVTAPEFPANFPFTVLRKDPPRPSKNSQTYITNGKITQINQYTITLVYQLKPKFEGQHQIPAMDVTVDGKTYPTDSITITVGKADATVGNSAQLKAAFASEQAMLGYVVTLTYDILLPVQIDARNVGVQLPTEFITEHFTTTVQDWEQLPWKHGSRTINGLPCETFHLELQLIPKHDGTITLPSAVMTFEVPDRQQRSRRRSPFGSFFDDDFGDPFGMFGNYKTITNACDEITLEVQPLPTEGQPADFTGIVGQLRVNASLSTSEATVGEPVLLDLALSGVPNLTDAKLPDLAKNPEFASHFKVFGDDPALEKDGQTVFQRTLRATTPGELTIPPIPFSYFDPKAREYRTATTQPIPLKVTAARQVTLEDAEGATVAPAVAQPAPTAIAVRTSGLEPDFPLEDLTHNRLSVISAPRNFLVPLLCLAIPPALWLVCAMATFLARRRDATGSERAAHGAKGILLRTIARLKADDPQAGAKFSAALQAFFAARFHLPPGAVTYADAEAAALRNGFTTEQIAPFRELFATCEAAQFAGGDFDLAEVQNHLKTAIKEF
ncbi:MAG: BatD family protein [Victivallales bacterium]|nr:BatD family protein [Victivallales bacterium]